MKKSLISVALILLSELTLYAYDRHGRDYTVNGGSGSSTMLLFIGVILLFLFLWFNSGKKDKK